MDSKNREFIEKLYQFLMDNPEAGLRFRGAVSLEPLEDEDPEEAILEYELFPVELELDTTNGDGGRIVVTFAIPDAY